MDPGFEDAPGTKGEVCPNCRRHLRAEGRYQALTPNERGWLWSAELELWLGSWRGTYLGDEAAWLRLFDKGGSVVPTWAEAERNRAESAETELARLRAGTAGAG